MYMGKIFKRGLLALAPVAISIVIIVWLLRTLEDIFSVPLKAAIGPYYFPGMGLLVAIIFIFFVGVIINNYLIQKCTNALNRLFTRIPLFKTIYNSIGDMMAYFQPKDEKKRGKMVIVEVDSLQFLAILTREDFSDLPQGIGGDDDRVNIFILPQSPDPKSAPSICQLKKGCAMWFQPG